MRLTRRGNVEAFVPQPATAALFVAHGLPEPVEEYRFHLTRKWRFDYAWPERLLALEVEGGIWTRGRHTRGAGFMKDMEKYNAAALFCWRVLRCTPDQLKSGEAAAMVKQAYEQARAA